MNNNDFAQLQHKQMLEREQFVINSLPESLRDNTATVKRSAEAMGLPVDCMQEWHKVSGHLPVPIGTDVQQDHFVSAWNEKKAVKAIAEVTHDYATEVHTNHFAPGVVFFRYPVGPNAVETSLQATAETLAHSLGPAAFDPKGNIVGISHQTAATIRAVLKASI